MNDIYNALVNRRSVRKFKNKSVNKEQLKQIEYAALLSPSSRNLQPWHLSVVNSPAIIDEMDKFIVDYHTENDDTEILESLKKVGNTIFYHVPAVFFITVSEDADPRAMIDVGIMAQSIAIAAISQGLESVILGRPRALFAEHGEKDNWKKKLTIPKENIFGIAVGVGYGEQIPPQREPDLSKSSWVK